MDPTKVAAIIEALKAFLVFAEKLEVLVDPDEKITIDDTIIGFLKMLVSKVG